MKGYICQGFNPLQAFPDKGKIRRALGKLKYLVVMDPLDTETSRFWENFGPQNPSNPASIRTEVFQLPTTCFAEENGTLVNSARWLQWHWKAAPPPGKRSPIFLSWPDCFTDCARCIARTAAPSLIRSSI